MQVSGFLNIYVDDIENQNAAYLAKQVDKDGRRTVGMSMALTQVQLQ
jgi:hypothetical protein